MPYATRTRMLSLRHGERWEFSVPLLLNRSSRSLLCASTSNSQDLPPTCLQRTMCLTRSRSSSSSFTHACTVTVVYGERGAHIIWSIFSFVPRDWKKRSFVDGYNPVRGKYLTIYDTNTEMLRLPLPLPSFPTGMLVSQTTSRICPVHGQPYSFDLWSLVHVIVSHFQHSV